MFKKFGVPAIISLLLGAAYFYVSLPALNLRSSEFWTMIVFVAIVYLISFVFIGGKKLASIVNFTANGGKPPKFDVDFNKISKKVKIAVGTFVAIIAVVILVTFITSSELFNAKKYQQMISVETSDFAQDIDELPFSNIPVVDRDTAERLGKRAIGEVVELVSQFEVSDYYTQINYAETPVRVSPLEYNGILKWFANKNEGIQYYVKVNMASQDTQLVRLDEGMKFSPSEYFSRDLERHIRFAYPTKMFEELYFEIDDNGHPYWVMSYYEYTFGLFGGKDITGVILVDAVTGEMTDHPIDEVPSWIDRVYTADLVIEQSNYWGTYTDGYWNSVFAQKNVVKTTDGYNYIVLNDDVWLYTGITSVASDQSNIGFLLINMRTKECKRYTINGAEEYSAMSSAEGKVQAYGYVSTFPILINVENQPTYFMSLKDNAGLVKNYAFVSVSNYQIVGVGEDRESARNDYIKNLTTSGILVPENEQPEPEKTTETKSFTVQSVASAVVDGNTIYYIKTDDIILTANITISPELPFLTANQTITVEYETETNRIININLD